MLAIFLYDSANPKFASVAPVPILYENSLVPVNVDPSYTDVSL